MAGSLLAKAPPIWAAMEQGCQSPPFSRTELHGGDSKARPVTGSSGILGSPMAAPLEQHEIQTSTGVIWVAGEKNNNRILIQSSTGLVSPCALPCAALEGLHTPKPSLPANVILLSALPGCLQHLSRVVSSSLPFISLSGNNPEHWKMVFLKNSIPEKWFS